MRYLGVKQLEFGNRLNMEREGGILNVFLDQMVVFFIEIKDMGRGK